MISTKERIVLIILFVLLWFYLWLRAYFVPFSHDEIATFFHYIHTGRFIPFVDAHWYANNHLLNTFLAFCFYKIFGASELSLRLPNLLFFPVFFFFLYKISGEIKRPVFRWFFVISLCFAHYFFDFFALCRGYGIAMSSLMAALYFLMQAVKTNETKYYFRSVFFVMLAAAANLTLINSFTLLIFLLCANMVWQWKSLETKTKLKQGLIVLFTGIAPLAFLAAYALALQKRGLLDVGTSEGFWKVTLLSNTQVFTGSESHWIAYYVLFFFAVICVFFIALLLKNPSISFFRNPRFVFFYLLAGNILITLFLGIFFNVNYPEDRAAMYLFPLLIGAFAFLADDVSKSLKPSLVALPALPLLFLPVHFFLHLNIDYASYWKNLRIPYRFYDKVMEHTKNSELQPTVAGYRMRGFAWHFINFRRGSKLSQLHYEGYPETDADFQLAHFQHRSDWLEYYDSLDYDKHSEIWLLKKKKPIEKKTLVHTEPKSTAEESSDEYWNIYETEIDSLRGKTLLLSFDFSLETKHHPFIGQVVASVHDINNKLLRYEWLRFDFLKSQYKGEPHNFRYNMIVHKLPPEAHRLIVYVWNIHRQPYTVRDAVMKMEELK